MFFFRENDSLILAFLIVQIRYFAFLVLILAAILIPWVKKIEKRSHYDVNVNFNPLSVYSTKHDGYNFYEAEKRARL